MGYEILILSAIRHSPDCRSDLLRTTALYRRDRFYRSRSFLDSEPILDFRWYDIVDGNHTVRDGSYEKIDGSTCLYGEAMNKSKIRHTRNRKRKEVIGMNWCDLVGVWQYKIDS